MSHGEPATMEAVKLPILDRFYPGILFLLLRQKFPLAVKCRFVTDLRARLRYSNMTTRRPYRRRGGITHVSGVLYKTVYSSKVGVKIKLFCLWNEVVGEPVAKVAQPVDFRGKTLYVSVRDAVWVRQLKFLEEMILQKLNGKVGPGTVDGLYFSVSGVNSLQTFKKGYSVDRQRIYEKKVEKMVCPSEEDVASISDEETRQVFLRIRSKLLGMQNAKK